MLHLCFLINYCYTMNTDELKNRRPHLTKEQRLPNCYKEAEKILRIVKSCQANLKTALFNSKLRRNVFHKVHALSINVLKRSHLLNAIIEEIRLLEKEPTFRKELAGILIHELIFGKGLPGKSKPVEVIRKYEQAIFKANNSLSTEAKFRNCKIISIPKYVRINTLVTTLSEVLEDLEYFGVKQIFYSDSISNDKYVELLKSLELNNFLIDKHFKDLLVFQNGENLTTWPLYQRGHVFIQDKSSYIPALVLAPEPGSYTIDACAAPGMKTLHLTAMMENKGTLFAFEKDKTRFGILKDILQMGHAEICQTICKDFNKVDVNDDKYSSVEYILLDPSCSGSGMVSRMDFVTDTETSKDELRIQKLAGFQIILLKRVLQFPSVKRVVYSTCSITETENEYVVQEALSHFSHRFKLSAVLPNWPIRGSEKYEFGHLCLRADPEQCLTNGFFVAMFERIECLNEREKKTLKKKNKRNKVKKDEYINQYEEENDFCNTSSYEQPDKELPGGFFNNAEKLHKKNKDYDSLNFNENSKSNSVKDFKNYNESQNKQYGECIIFEAKHKKRHKKKNNDHETIIAYEGIILDNETDNRKFEKNYSINTNCAEPQDIPLKKKHRKKYKENFNELKCSDLQIKSLDHNKDNSTLNSANKKIKEIHSKKSQINLYAEENLSSYIKSHKKKHKNKKKWGQ